MKLLILTEFEGYPNGDDKPPVTFRPSSEAVDVSDAFGEMIVAKGLAQAQSGKAAKPIKPAPGDA